MVSDVRAATPSEAAEIASSETTQDTLKNISEYINKLKNSTHRLLSNFKYELQEQKNVIEKNNPSTKIYNYYQTIDIFYETLKSKFLSNLLIERDKVNLLKIKLKNSNPSNKIITLESAVANKKELVKSLLNSVLEKKKNIVELRKNTIRDISPLNILEKGYSVIYSKGKIAKKTADFKINDDVTIKIIDGVVSSNITKIRKD